MVVVHAVAFHHALFREVEKQKPVFHKLPAAFGRKGEVVGLAVLAQNFVLLFYVKVENAVEVRFVAVVLDVYGLLVFGIVVLAHRNFDVNALRKLDKIRKEREELLKIRRAEAMDKAGKLRGQTLTIAVKAVEGDEEGKLYGSVTAADIAKALTEAGVAVDPAMVKLTEPIKNLGTTDLTIALMPQIEVTLRLAIIAE